ncbi:MAG: class B sortase [Oscillospiraceae bacterium]|nr:class B sortase [Oscillospiraceae bacterium]
MNIAAKAGIRAIRIANGLINTVVLIVILLLLAFGCYTVWDSGQVFGAASFTHYEMFKPTAENNAKAFKELQAINSDVFAWLTVYGTNIDYPVVQGADNIKYVNTSAEGRHSLSGAIFLDYRSRADFSDFSSILYGHHMEAAAMFGEIGLFSAWDYFDARKYGTLYFDGQEHGLEFFAFVHADAYDNSVFRVRVTGEDEQEAYLGLLMEMAMHTRKDVSVTIDDRIVLLSTCSADSTNGRDILIGKIVETIHSDPFAVETTAPLIAIPVIDELGGSWVQADLWVKIVLVALPCVLVLLVILMIFKKKPGEGVK